MWRRAGLSWVWAGLALATSVLNAAASAASTTPCAFGAFVKETDPAGLNVRQAPRATAKILGTLPPVRVSTELQGYAVKVEVNVIGTDRGWFLIEQARDNTALTGQPARPMFSGRGWVSGTQLTVKSQARKGHVEPRRSAPVVVQWKDEASFDGDLFVNSAQLLACRGPWAQLEIDTSAWRPEDVAALVLKPAAKVGLSKSQKGRFRAWFVELCGNQESSCDGTASQEPPRR